MSEVPTLNIGREAISGFLGQVAQNAISFVATIIFARYLSPDEYGGFIFFLVIAGFLQQPMSGWGTAGKKRISETLDRAGEAISIQLLFNLGWILLVAVPVLLLSSPLSQRTGFEFASVLLIAYLLTGATVETMYPLIQGTGRVGLTTWIEAVHRVAGLGLRVAGVFVFGAVGLVYGAIGAAALLLPVCIYIIGARPTLPSRTLVRSYIRFGRYSVPAALLGTVAKRVDTLILGVLLTSATVAHYEVAWQLSLPGIFLAYSAGSALMTKVSSGQGLDSDASIVTNTVAYSSVLTVPIFFGAIALREDLVVALFGEAYTPAVPFLIGLAAYHVVRSQTDPMESAIYGLDRPDQALRVAAIGVVLNTTLGVGLLSLVGGIGVVVATIVSELFRYVAFVYILRTQFPRYIPLSRQHFEQIVAGAVMLVGTLAVGSLITFPAWLVVVVLVTIGAALYGTVLVTVSPMHREIARSVVDTVSSPSHQ